MALSMAPHWHRKEPSPERVADDRVSYPLTTHAFQLGQVFTTYAVMFGAVGTGSTIRRDLTS